MSGRFDLPVTYKGEERSYDAQLVSFGYTYKFLVDIDGHNLTFETDDEGSFRVLGGQGDTGIDRELLQSVIDSLRYLTSK